MPDRYWVGGTASWDGTAGTKWAATSGGAGGASVPTTADDVFFDAASGAVTVTVSTVRDCRSLNFTGFTGTLTGAGSIQAQGNVIVASGMTWTFTGILWILGGVTQTLTTNGKSLTCAVSIDNSATVCSLEDALTITAPLTVTRGTFTTNNFNVTATSLNSNSANTRTINLGSSTVTLSGSGSVVQFSTTTGLTFNAGTSTIVLSSATAPNLNVAPSGLTFNNVSFTGANATQQQVSGANTFNNLSVAGRTSAGIKPFIFDANQVINGILTLSAGTNATMRTFVQSDTIGTQRTLNVNSFAAGSADIDFRDITITGAAAPISGTRFGDCKGNGGITFPAAKTVYWKSATISNWGANNWASSDAGSADLAQFPLAQDTAVFLTFPNSGQQVTINAAYNIGTIDMSARTSNTMTLATGSNTPAIYGNWINGTGVTLTGSSNLIFAGRTTQNLTSAGKTFTQGIDISSPGGTVVLQDAYTTSRSATSAFTLSFGTLNAAGYNITLSGVASGASMTGSGVRGLSLGSGVFTIAGSGTAWNATTSTNLTITGTGTISLTSASAKTFAGGGIQTYPTINQGGTGALTITGSNKFANITDTALGPVLFAGGSINDFTAFNLGGNSTAARLTIGSTNTTQATLRKPTAWNVGTGSLDGGNNTGLSFTAGANDFLNISYINGVLVAAASQVFYGSTNVSNIRYGSTPVSAIFYGSTKVF